MFHKLHSHKLTTRMETTPATADQQQLEPKNCQLKQQKQLHQPQGDTLGAMLQSAKHLDIYNWTKLDYKLNSYGIYIVIL